ncbi:MAG: tolB [Actinomycetia bacterium]|jgi:TolB protein|nr:tolB [Actinomycetes bacterium]
MSKVDDELSRRFQQAQRPVRSDDLLAGLARRRHRREVLRRVQAGGLALAVLAATAVGFVALQRAFEEEGRGRTGAPLPGNGEIVFSAGGADGFVHLYAMQPDGSGRRQITDFGTDDTAPAVSPDGRTIAFVHQLEEAAPAIATIKLDGGTVTWLTDPDFFVSDGPSWSPDGTRIAFAATHGEGQRIYVMGADGSDPRPITPPDVYWPDGPAWSPDGTRIAFAASAISGDDEPSVWDIYTVSPDGGALTNVTQTSDGLHDEGGPTWSPDGHRIAFTRNGSEGSSIVIRGLSDGVETQVTDGTFVEGSPAWAPDGRWIAFDRAGVERDPGEHPAQQDVWLVHPDGTGERRLTTDGAFAPTWQPIPVDASPPSPAPSVLPTPEPEGRDIGLAFNLCHAERLGRIDFLGEGMNGQAWVGVTTKDDGSCPSSSNPDAQVVAADVDGDGRAEAWNDLPWECNVLCVPHDATDLDGDGTEELIVASYFSIVDYYVMRYLGPSDEPSSGIVPVLVGHPGHEPAGVRAGEPLRIDAGGDAGYSSEIVCEPPVLGWNWAFAPVDSQDPTEVHSVELELRDGEFVVVGTNDYTVSAGEPTGVGDDTEPSCGVDWDFWTGP